MIKAVFFDIDGTLVDTNEFHVMTWEAAMRAEGCSVSRAVIRGHIGMGSDMLLPAVFPTMTQTKRVRISNGHARLFAKHYLHRAKPFPSAKQLIERLARDEMDIVLASSAQKSEILHYVALLDIGRFISGVVSADDVQHSKPAPDIFATALGSVASLNPDEALVVADTPFDVESAAKSRLRTIAVRSGGFPDSTLKGAVALFDNVKGLLARLSTSPLQRG
jgi:HAD superfamily hydrolase (TIGR01509 family)